MRSISDGRHPSRSTCGAPLQTLDAENLACAEAVWLEAGPNPLCLGMVKSILNGKSHGTANLSSNPSSRIPVCKSLLVLPTQGINIR